MKPNPNRGARRRKGSDIIILWDCEAQAPLKLQGDGFLKCYNVSLFVSLYNFFSSVLTWLFISGARVRFTLPYYKILDSRAEFSEENFTTNEKSCCRVQVLSYEHKTQAESAYTLPGLPEMRRGDRWMGGETAGGG